MMMVVVPVVGGDNDDYRVMCRCLGFRIHIYIMTLALNIMTRTSIKNRYLHKYMHT